MINIIAASEGDLERILEIEQETISPPWTHGTLLSELYREDTFFAAATLGNSQFTIHNSQLSDALDKFGGIDNYTSDAEDVMGDGTHDATHDETNIDGADGAIVGFVILRRMVDEGELLQIAVDKAARRRGVADMLLSAALGYAEQNNLKSVYLEVRKSNAAAIALYEKHGFKPLRHRKNYYSNPTEDATVMLLDTQKDKN